jgi:hypothetical protein
VSQSEHEQQALCHSIGESRLRRGTQPVLSEAEGSAPPMRNEAYRNRTPSRTEVEHECGRARVSLVPTRRENELRLSAGGVRSPLPCYKEHKVFHI